MFNPGRNSTLCFAALFWAPAFSIGCHHSLTPGWGHSCPGHPQLWPFGDSDLFFQISLIIIIIFIFNQELLWEPENGLDLEAHTQALTSSALLLPLSLLVIGASVGGGGLGATRPVCCAVCCGELPLRDSLPPRPASDPSPHFLLGCQLSPFPQSSGAVCEMGKVLDPYLEGWM